MQRNKPTLGFVLLATALAGFPLIAAGAFVLLEDEQPTPKTITRTVTKDPYASFRTVDQMEERIDERFYQACVLRESRKGIAEGTTRPRVGDRVVIVCTARRYEGSA